MHNVLLIFFSLSFKGKIMFPKKELSQIIMLQNETTEGEENQQINS